MIKNGKQMLVVIGVFVLTLLLGTVTFAFFNYTRTGSANRIKTGRIAFNSEQGTAINLTNMFPIDSSETGIMDDATKVGTVTINVTGDTTYTEGLEYLVTATNVTNTVGNKSLPISIDVSVTNNSNNDPTTTLGTSSNDYYNERGGDTSYYSVLTGETINTDDKLLVGYIAPGADGVDGNIVIKAYLDKNKVAITDTYPERDVTHTENEGTEQEEEVVDYTNGTTSTWVGERVVFTTTEWNTLQTNGVSFQIKVESNEGIWVEEPIQTAAETIGALLTETNAAGNKIYTGSDPDNYVWFNNEQWRIIGIYGDNLKIIKATPSTTSQKWQNSDSDGNTWSGSLMQSTYLYNTYWGTLSATAQGMIEQSATWNVGACEYSIAAQAAYTCASGTTWTGKIGLIASYEYLYAAENDGTCWTTSGYYYDGGCHQKDWLYSTITNSGSSNAWIISPYSDYSSGTLTVMNYGHVHYNPVRGGYAASPVVYLKPEVTITGGNGQIGETNSYKLG